METLLYVIVGYLAFGVLAGSVVTAYNVVEYERPNFKEGLPEILLWPGHVIGLLIWLAIEWLPPRKKH